MPESKTGDLIHLFGYFCARGTNPSSIHSFQMKINDTLSEPNRHSLSKNAESGNLRTWFQKNDLCLLSVQTETSEPWTTDLVLKQGLIHFYFCLEGEAVFAFGPHYSREIRRDFNYFFYNPEKDLGLQLTLKGNTRMVYLSISIKSLHDLFVDEPNGLPILDQENAGRKFYDERQIPPSIRMALTSIQTTQLNDASARLFYQGKILEILSLYFAHRVPDAEACPFLNDQETVRKIKIAKDHLLRHMDNPPGLVELARLAGLNEYQLKVGFREVYGNTVFGFLLDHRLDQARLMLDQGNVQVNEVAWKIGYANTSHFIAAFRKKFGVTPKKYLMARSQRA